MARPTLHIIDDDEGICSEISSALVASGYECSWATSADSVKAPGVRNPDVLLLDLCMPGVDGFQVIRRLAGETHQPHLIVASGHEQRIIRAAVRCARDAGLNVLGSLGKPYSIKSLLALVDAAAQPAPKPAAGQAISIGKLVQGGAPRRHMQTAYQSKRLLTDGSIGGYEALLRVAVDGILISPEAMFEAPVGLETQLALTRAVLDDALQFGSALRSAGTPSTISVNCTPAILCTPELPDLVLAALDRWQMPAGSLMIEITEHAAEHSFDVVAAAACRLAMRGCGISIDDFGRGTTSLERLFDLPLTELKIDKEIFWKCFDGREPSGLLKEVVHYCEERDIASTIEGIETPEHLNYAFSLGARYGQGYLWDRPSTDTAALIERSSGRLEGVARA